MRNLLIPRMPLEAGLPESKCSPVLCPPNKAAPCAVHSTSCGERPERESNRTFQSCTRFLGMWILSVLHAPLYPIARNAESASSARGAPLDCWGCGEFQFLTRCCRPVCQRANALPFSANRALYPNDRAMKPVIAAHGAGGCFASHQMLAQVSSAAQIAWPAK